MLPDSDNMVFGYHDTRRVHPIIYMLVTMNLATYSDLKYKLDIEDMLNLYEICMVNIFNKNLANMN